MTSVEKKPPVEPPTKPTVKHLSKLPVRVKPEIQPIDKPKVERLSKLPVRVKPEIQPVVKSRFKPVKPRVLSETSGNKSRLPGTA